MDVVDQAKGNGWAMFLGDSSEVLGGLKDESVDLSVFSVPFGHTLYVYSASERDLGNCRTAEEFAEHYGFIIRELFRVTKLGRLCCVHCADVPTLKSREGVIGLSDFPGDNIRAYQAAGWTYYGRVTVDKDPQAAAITKHSLTLSFQQLKKDACRLAPVIGDYILLFRKEGQNPSPVAGPIDNEAWIAWARNVWYGIRQTVTLNAAEAKADADGRHVCPLQLDTIERCVRLYSNPGEVVLDPFAGIGSTGYEAVRLGRRFVGVELKGSYYTTACLNLRRAEALVGQRTLFDEDAADAA